MTSLAGIVGQEAIVKRLRGLVEFSRARRTPIDHIALTGPPGSGKRTIALALAQELGVDLKWCLSGGLERKGSLTAMLTALEPGEILFLEEPDQLRKPMREILLTALAEFRIELVIGMGAAARVHPFKLAPFTCVCAAERESGVPPDLRGSFSLVLPLERYGRADLAQIACRCAQLGGLSISPGAASLAAQASGSTPGQVDLFIKRLARAGHKHVAEDSVRQLLDAYGSQGGAGVLPPEADPPGGRSGADFEKLIAAVLGKMGFRSELTRASGDGGIDIVAVLEKPLVGGRYLIQCKNFAAGNLVGAPLVREFYGAVRADPRAVKGIFITTSGFTEQARQFAENLSLELIDGEGLRRLLEG
jgi:Holliday junction DNA helicase RuvB P-loop domain/Restriction endonuclease